MYVYGFEQSDFVGKDGNTVSGFWLYLGRPIAQDKGVGYSVTKVYVLASRLPGGPPAVNSRVQVLYTNRGKVAAIQVLEGPPSRK